MKFSAMKYRKAYFLRAFVFMAFSTHFFMGTAFAVPTKITDRSEYSTSLNSVASVIMNWYGSLITVNDKTSANSAFDTSQINEQLLNYRSKYPQNISQIVITSTELSRLSNSNDYQFKVKSKISYKTDDDDKEHSRSLDETFVINGSLLTDKNITPIKAVSLDKAEETKKLETSQYNRAHYKVREFTYAWLAYIDGIKTLAPSMNAKAWINQATYSLKMGAEKTDGSIATVLSKKKELLAKGGHLLRSLDVIKNKNNPNVFVIDLVLEWKGTNQTGKSVIAKISQKIKVKINTDNSWEVISIKEEHLLPIIAPWMGLVC